MAIRRYLAMTALEFSTYGQKTENLAYMACHFSPYGTALSNIPTRLPKDSMVILNDRIPIAGHDPLAIRDQLHQLILRLGCSRVLLDFQRPGDNQTARVVQALAGNLPCPVGVSECYALEANCPVFLPPVPPDTLLADHLAPWAGREIWLEETPACLEITITAEGAVSTFLSPALFPESGHWDEKLLCHSRLQMHSDCATFTLWRTETDWDALVREAENRGVTCRIGLWQDWK